MVTVKNAWFCISWLTLGLSLCKSPMSVKIHDKSITDVRSPLEQVTTHASQFMSGSMLHFVFPVLFWTLCSVLFDVGFSSCVFLPPGFYWHGKIAHAQNVCACYMVPCCCLSSVFYNVLQCKFFRKWIETHSWSMFVIGSLVWSCWFVQLCMILQWKSKRLKPKEVKRVQILDTLEWKNILGLKTHLGFRKKKIQAFIYIQNREVRANHNSPSIFC